MSWPPLSRRNAARHGACISTRFERVNASAAPGSAKLDPFLQVPFPQVQASGAAPPHFRFAKMSLPRLPRHLAARCAFGASARCARGMARYVLVDPSASTAAGERPPRRLSTGTARCAFGASARYARRKARFGVVACRAAGPSLRHHPRRHPTRVGLRTRARRLRGGS